MKSRFPFLFLLVIFSTSAIAGGLIGDALSTVGNAIVPGSNIGKPLDDANREFKRLNPVYGTIEDGTSAAVRHATQEAMVESAGPVLAGLIQASRNDTLRGGVADVPPFIRQAMAQFYGSDVAAGIRYRIGQGGDLALASNAFRYGDAVAITLGDLIVFRDNQVASDLSVWAHELTHVQQYRSWGVMDFAKRYVRDHDGVEQPAYDTQNRFIQWSAIQVRQGSPFVPPFQPVMMTPMPQLSNICATPLGACIIPAVAPPGWGCFCGSMQGPVNGMIVSR